MRHTAWERWLEDVFLDRVRIAALLATVLVPAGWGLDFLLEPSQVWPFLWIRLAFSAGTFAVFLLSFAPPARKLPGVLAFGVSVWIAIGIELLVLRSGGVASDYYDGLNVLIIAAGLLFPWGARGMGLTCLAILAVHLAPALAHGVPLGSKDLIGHAYFLFNSGLVAITAAWFGARARRREFDQRADLEARTVELREATGNLRETVEQLRTVDRMKDAFFASVSHELRTPLTVILAIVETLAQEPLPAHAQGQLAALGRQGEALLALINDLLSLVELDAGRVRLVRRPVDLNVLARDLVAELVPLAERRNQTLVVRCEARSLFAADPARLNTLLRNLLSNALKFTPAGGEIRVRVAEELDAALLEVEDTGPGIPQAERARIFERFARLPEAQAAQVPGWGIGLSLVHEVAQLHGGKVEVDEAPGGGARFRVRLPRASLTSDEQAPPAGEAPTRASFAEQPLPAGAAQVRAAPWPKERPHEEPLPPRSAPASHTVLVVEDHAELRALLVDLLAREYQVLESADGEEALRLARERRPDLVLSDVMLPGRSGHSLVEALRGDPATAEIRLVLLTALRGSEAAVRGLGAGADDYLPKPFSPHELLARVRAQLRIRDLDRALAKSQKLAAVGTLLAGLAHEIRNPINAMVNGVPALRRALPAVDGVASELLEVVEDSARRVSRIVDDLLGMARGEEPAVTSWDPNDAAERALRMLALRPGHLEIQKELRFSGTVRGQPHRLDRVLVNLFDNASRAMADKGGVLRVRTEAEGGGVRITVQDSGPGFAPEHRARLFDPFFTTRRVGEGTGLGLHLCQQIATAHRGRLEASSSPEGATFTLWLPEEPR